MFYIMFGILALIIIIAISSQQKKGGYRDKNHPENRIRSLQKKTARLIYSDKKASQIFRSNKYKISAKPDFIYNVSGKYVLIEYKSRNSAVRESDEYQVIAATLAVRSKYPISKAIIYTSGNHIKEIMLGSDEEIYSKIKVVADKTRISKNRVKPCIMRDKSPKCRYCGYKEICK